MVTEFLESKKCDLVLIRKGFLVSSVSGVM